MYAGTAGGSRIQSESRHLPERLLEDFSVPSGTCRGDVRSQGGVSSELDTDGSSLS